MSRIDSLQQVVADSVQQAHIADSLHQIFVADSLHRVFVADSIEQVRLTAERAMFGDEAVFSDVAFGESTLREVSLGETALGEVTYRAAQVADSGVGSLVSNNIYIILVSLFLLVYLMWLPHIIRNGAIRWSYLKHRYRRISSEGERDVVGRQRMGVQIVAWSLFVTMFSMVAARAVAQYSYVELDFSGTMWIVGALVAAACIAVYEIMILRIGGYLSLNMQFVSMVLSTKRQFMIFGVIFASPIFIIGSIANYSQGELVLQLSGIVAVGFVLFFLRQSFLLFIRQNFSILHWFLYLCGVEILPLTFIWAVTTRYLVN